MIFRRPQAPETRQREQRGGAASAAGETQASPSLARVIDRVFRKSKPEILDLGPICGSTVVYLANRGARVSVEEFVPPPPTPDADPYNPEKEIPLVPLSLNQSAGSFDLVLAWELCDFIPPDRLAEFGGEVRRVLVEGGWLLLFSMNPSAKHAPKPGRPGRFRVIADDRLVREEPAGAARRRWAHPTRQIERALGPLDIQGIHLQRCQMREFLALKGRA